MHFKLVIALVEDDKTDAVMEAAREAGATGATVVNNARGEGVEKEKTFLGLTLTTQRDMLMFLVEEHSKGLPNQFIPRETKSTQSNLKPGKVRIPFLGDVTLLGRYTSCTNFWAFTCCSALDSCLVVD